MAILGGLFSKKDKSKPKPPSSVLSSADIDIESFNDGSEYDHVLLHPNTVYQNAAASSSKMKLPFAGSKSKLNLAPTDTPSPTDLASTSPHFSTESEPPHSYLTPPNKSAAFGGYSDSGSALSTSSLPNVSHARSESHETVKTTTPASAGKKSGGLFSWARSRKKSKPPPPPTPSEIKDQSFNLRSFRHVGGPETILGPDNATPLELPPARPRPRGDSVASDSSQRVSVAAFREMQARRSQAGSPTPQSSSRPSTQIDSHLRSGSPSLKLLAPSTSNSYNQPRGRSVPPRISPRTSTLRSSPTNSKSDSDSDSDHGPLSLSVQWRSKSEVGHSSSPDQRPFNGLPPGPRLRQQKSTSDASRLGKKPPMPVSVHAPARPAAIQTRFASRPPAQNVSAPVNNTPARRPPKDSDTSDPDDSDDDAPLATLVQPRRPGSATSNISARSLPPRPLIDIKSLNNSPLSSSPPVSVNPSPTVRSVTPTSSRNDVRPPTNINERLSSLAQGLTRPKPTSTVVSESTTKAASDNVSPTITAWTVPSRSMTAPPIVVPSVEEQPPVPAAIDKDSSPAPKSPTYSTPSDSAVTTPSVNTTEFPPIRDPRASLSLDDPTPIKPTPIHHRAPQSGFSVMSRPQYYSTPGIIPSGSSQKRAEEGESPDSIGDITAAMFSQLDLGFSPDEDRGSLDNTITKGPVTLTITKSTATSSVVPSSQTTPASAPTTPTVHLVGQTESALSTRPVLSDASPTLPPASVSKSATSSRRLVGRPRSSTLTASISSQPAQPSDDQPQPQIIPRSQLLKPVKSTISHVPGPRKGAITTTKTQSPPPGSRHKRVPSITSTSSESSDESSSSSPSIAPKKQKHPQPQVRSHQTASRLRSLTVSTLTTTNPPSPTKSSSNNSSSSTFNRPPQRPFAMRDKSPSSSTGDSSSGRLPITPRDGSEIGSEPGRGLRGKQQLSRTPELLKTGNDGLLSASNSEMGLKVKKLAHRKSASYDDSTLKGAMRGGSGVVSMTDEERRRERRRSEAKNAIELGKVMNGNINLDDDDDPTMGMNPRVNVMNPMMGMGPMGLGMGMGMGMGMPQQNVSMMMNNPWMQQPNPMLQQFVPPPPQSADPQLLAAHQHAMMAAKQAYQLAVAQQAMQAAGDEWERGSTLGWPSNGSAVMFPSGPRSLYAGSIYGGSEYGGPTNGWGASSVYGGGFGPSTSNRTPVTMRNYQQNGPSPSRGSKIDLSSTNSPEVRHPRPRVKTGPDAPGRPIATLMQQQQQARGRTPPPPSSWKRGAKPQP